MIKLHNHPHYDKLAKNWTKWRDLYEGDHSVLSSTNYLWPHELEMENGAIGKDGARLRAVRVQRSRYLNLMEPVVSRWLSFLFRRDPIVPDAIKAMFGEVEYSDVDGAGASFDSFIREKIGLNYVLYGKSVVSVDTSAVSAQTKAEARMVGARPFMEALCPIEVMDWQYSKDASRIGRYDFIRNEFELVSERQSSEQEPKLEKHSKEFQWVDGTVFQFHYKAKSNAINKTSEWELGGTPIPYPKLTRIPVSSTETESFVRDAAEMQLLLFNLMSAESSGLNSQAFQRIFLAGNLGTDQKMLMNEYLVNFIPEGSVIQTVEPFNNAPLSLAIDKCIARVFQVAFNQLNPVSMDSKEAPGAETRREMKDEFIALVQTSLSEIEDLTNNVVQDYAALKGATVTEKVTFDKKITEDDVDKEIALWQAHADDFKQVASLRKGVITKHAKYFGLDNEQEVLDEIKNKTFDAQAQADPQARNDLLRGMVGGQ